MKRGPKSILTPQLQKHICESLEKCNTIKTAAAYCNVSERSVFSWISTNPSFAAAVSRARAKGKTCQSHCRCEPEGFPSGMLAFGKKLSGRICANGDAHHRAKSRGTENGG